MFGIQKDRRVVEITIEFNVNEIGKWLKEGAKFDDLNKIDRNPRAAVSKKYVIDMFPIGKRDNGYFHRSKGIISQNIGGSHFLKKDERFISWDDQDVTYVTENKVGLLKWGIWRGRLGLYADKHLVLLTPPLTEVLELESAGTLSNPGSIKEEDVKIRVPVSFHKNKQPKEFMAVWRGSNSDRSLGYGNALGHVSFSTLNYEVEY